MLELTEKMSLQVTLVPEPFSSETAMEDYIASHPDRIGLERIVLRQSHLPCGIPDLVGIDGAGRLVVVEVKAKSAGYAAAAQLINYMIWFEENPRDAAIACGLIPDSKGIAAAGNCRGVLAASSVADEALSFARRFKGDVSFYTVGLWATDGKKAVLIENTDPRAPGGRLKEAGLTGGHVRRGSSPYEGEGAAKNYAGREWTRDAYLMRYPEEVVDAFYAAAKELAALAEEEQLPVSGPVYRKEYATFKDHSGRKAFGVRFTKRTEVSWFVVMPLKEAEKAAPKLKFRYIALWRETAWRLLPGDSAGKYLDLFKSAIK